MTASLSLLMCVSILILILVSVISVWILVRRWLNRLTGVLTVTRYTTHRRNRRLFDLVQTIDAVLTSSSLSTHTPRQPLSRSDITGHYALVPTLMTATELRFAAVLRDMLPPEYMVMTQVSLHRVVRLRRPRRNRQWLNPEWNKISQKSLDFVVVRRTDTKIMLAIELDDPSHERVDRIARDELLDAIMEDAGVPLLHIPTSTMMAKESIQQQLMPLLVST